MLKFLLVLLSVVPCHAMDSQEYGNLMDWMAQDSTDHRQYVNVSYDCLAFSQDFLANATASGFSDIYMANIQGSKYPEGHWINAALVNGNYRFIEPQGDIELELEDAQIIISDPDSDLIELPAGKNKITITGNLLIPVKMPKL